MKSFSSSLNKVPDGCMFANEPVVKKASFPSLMSNINESFNSHEKSHEIIDLVFIQTCCGVFPTE